MSGRRSGLWRAYRVPALLAGVSVAGLLSALLEDGIFDVLSWVLLGGVLIGSRSALAGRSSGR